MANNGDSLDVNSMYSILKNIFNRELNENYTNRNRSTFAGGLADLRNGWAAMQNARKNKKDQAEYKNSMGNGGGNQYPNGSIGATGDGIYGVNSMPPQPNGGGIGVDANGVYGVNGETPQPNKYTFNESDYIPSAQNGYHLGNYPQTEMYGSPADFQRQMASNAIGYNLGSFEPRQQTWFPKDNANGGGGFDWGKTSPMPKENSAMDAWNNQGGNSMFSGMGGGEKPDNTMNITSQTIGNNYNGRIDGQVGGLGIPQSPQGDGGFNSVFNGANANPYQPSISSSDVAQGIGGQNVSANDLSRYLGNEYNRAAWIQQDMANNGVTNPLISMLRYDTKVAPLIKAAKEEELRNAFFTLRNPDASDQEKMNAMALIEYRKGDPFLEENQQMRRDANTMRMQDLQSRITDRNQRSLGDYAGMNLEGQSWVRNGDSVDLSNAQPHTIAGLNHISDIFQQMTGKPLIVTSGNDGDMHAGGQFSHGKGWKIDVSGNGLEDPEIRHAFIQQCQNLGIQVLDEYENPSANSTGGHLDLQFSGYRGNVKARPRNNRNTYTNGTSSYGNTKIKDMTEKEYTGIKTAITKLNEDNSAESAQALIDSLKNEYGRILFKTGSPEKAIKQLHDDLVGGRFGKLNQNEAQIKNIVASAYASVAGGMDERERKKNEEIAMAYLNGKKKEETKEKPQNKEEKKDKKIKPAEFNENVNYNYFPEDELNDSDFGGAIKKASNYQLINLKDPTRESLRGDLENLMTRNTIDRERLDEGY